MSLHLLSFVVQTAHTASFPMVVIFLVLLLIKTVCTPATPSRPNIAAANVPVNKLPLMQGLSKIFYQGNGLLESNSFFSFPFYSFSCFCLAIFQAWTIIALWDGHLVFHAFRLQTYRLSFSPPPLPPSLSQDIISRLFFLPVIISPFIFTLDFLFFTKFIKQEQY